MGALFDALIAASVRRRGLVLVIAAAGLVAGLYITAQAPLDVLPDFTPPRVVVQTEAPGMGTTEVEERVTWPLERALLGTPRATSIRSSSIAGLSVITLVFEDGVDVFRTRQLVAERLQIAADGLPRGVEAPALEPIAPPIGALLKLCITTSDPDLARGRRDLRTFADWRIRPRLAAVPGIAQIVIHGGRVERIEVRADPRRLRERDVSLDAVARAVERSQAMLGAGAIVAGELRVDVTIEARLTLADVSERLAAAVVEVRDGWPIRIGDVADLVVGETTPVGDTLYDGRPAVYLQVMKLPWADTVATTREVERALDELRADLPEGMRLEPPVFRQASFVHTSVRSVGHAMSIGAVLVVVVLVALLRSARLAAISLAAIPLSIVAAATVLVVRGASINGMVLGGLAIAVGVVVDDAIVFVENVWRRLRDNARAATPRPPLEVVNAAASEIRGSVVYATAIICLVLVPVLLLGGIAGRIFAPLAETYILAIAASLMVAVTVTPAMCAWLLPPIATAEARPSRLALAMIARYRRVIRRVVDRPRPVVAAALVLIVAAAALVPMLGGGFLPDFHEESVILHVNAAPATSLDETLRLAGRVDALVRPGIASHTAARAGRAELGEDPFPTNRLEIDMVVGGEALEEKVDRLAARLRTLPGVTFAIEGFLGERIHEILGGETAPLVVEVVGSELEPLRRVAAELAERIRGVDGVEGVTVEAQVDVAEIRIRPDPVALAPYDLAAADIAEQTRTWRLGQPVGEILEADGRNVELVVVGPPELASRSALADLPITTDNGGAVALGTIAHLDDVAVPAAVSHVGGARRIAIGVDADPSRISGVASELERALRAVALPPGYRVAIGGEAAARGHAARRLAITGVLVLVGILVLLTAAFGRAADAVIVLVNFPLGLIGGVAGAMVLPEGLSVVGFVGFVTLFGIIARNGIMLVTHTRQLEREAPDEPPVERVLRAAEERLLPIVMTAATAGLGLLPLALSLGRAGSELEAPMAVIVCGGLISSTVLNMIVLPTVYVWLARRGARQVAR